MKLSESRWVFVSMPYRSYTWKNTWKNTVADDVPRPPDGLVIDGTYRVVEDDRMLPEGKDDSDN